MVVLGVDPGTLTTGYGIIESSGGKMNLIKCGAIRNDKKILMPFRLKLIFETLTSVTEQYKPDEFAIETAFYGKNAQSALKLGHARGVSILTAVLLGIPSYEYSPREIKKAIVGNGTASKEQVQFMVKSLLKLRAAPDHYDITDALAVAVCHLQRKQTMKPHAYKNWKAFMTAHPESVPINERMGKR